MCSVCVGCVVTERTAVFTRWFGPSCTSCVGEKFLTSLVSAQLYFVYCHLLHCVTAVYGSYLSQSLIYLTIYTQHLTRLL